ncbi:hypothetical protein NOR51B_1780 [Luminiphilus syltensis NOR5-1B]|uniref:Uncharacterized protein n=1 Tax=Luminiphilus syltensis NOR5-1B TaxID=565045 RepID=B8KVQ9_9GAMM|nr:hypothetical protein [Luminiphilus syltensis]EED35833.1 hypothetical protein NOR51B_1780 [Luminiphilus syltensis NOR5-1B]
MNYEDYIAEALEIVSAWEVPPEDFAQVVNDQAKIMAGTDLDPWHDLLQDCRDTPQYA